MEIPSGNSSTEIKYLHRCINDLVGVLALPAMWSGSEPSRIVQTLLDSLVGMLDLDFAYARLKAPVGDTPIEEIRLAQSQKQLRDPREVSEYLSHWFADDTQTWPSRLRFAPEDAEVSIVPLRLGLNGEIGVIIAGSERKDFPCQTEGLLLSVAANQAAIGLQDARLLFEQKRVARELDERVAQRTSELAAVNDDLKREVGERRRAEEALRARDMNSRLILDSIPGLVCTMSPAGEIELFNRQILEFFGKTPEELKNWANSDAVHPDDQARVIAAFTCSVTTGTPYDVEHRCRRADGVYRWFQVRALPVRNADAHITGWYVLLSDIDDRKRAENALRTSERYLHQIINTIPALAWSARPDGSADFFNQHYLDYVGMTSEQAMGWGWTAAVHPEDLSSMIAEWRRMTMADEAGECEGRLRRFDGQYRWLLFRTSPMRDASGKTVRWYGTNTDIDDRKRTEEELRRSEARKTAILDSALDCIMTIDHEGRITEFNLAAARTFGYTREDVVGKQLADVIIPPALRAQHRLGFARYLATGEARVLGKRLEMAAVRSDGTEFPVELTISRIQTSGPPSFTGYLRDITERKRAEEALSQARSDLAHVTRVTSLGVLTASIAHEVNQPLAGIVTNASTCLRMLAAEPPNVHGARETARRTIRDGNRAAELITRLRALFTRKDFANESVDLNDAAREVIALSVGDLQRNRVIVQSEFARELPVLTGDRVQLQQVILNLVKNAADAMSTVDDRPRKLRIKTERDAHDHVLLTVQDAGTGLDPRGMDRLFEAFYTTKNDGMGIGLSVSRSIIEQHHGRLWAVPNDGPGATFCFSIPSGQGV